MKNYVRAGMMVAIISIFFMFSYGVNAESEIQLQVHTGIGGEYKNNSWVPIEVTITNNSHDMEGHLVYDSPSGNTYYQDIAVAQGATKKETLLVPGHQINSSAEVQVLAGNKELAKEKVGGRMVEGDTLFIGVLAADPSTGSFLGALPQNKMPLPVRVTPLSAEDIPSFATPLQGLDVLLINNFPMDELNQEQQEALKQWALGGGTLIIAGGAHIEKISDSILELAPVKLRGTQQIEELSSLAEVTQKPLEIRQPVTISEAEARSGKTLFSEGSIPLIVIDQLGSGNIIYAAYDLVEEPFASWSGSGELWAETLSQVQFSSINSDQKNWWALQQAVNLIPSLTFPSMNTLAIIFVIYVLLVGPISFFILKKMNRREWFWGLVPLLACLFAVGIFLYGSAERSTNVMVHNVGFLELGHRGQAELTAVSAIFVPRGGDYAIQYEGDNMISPQGSNHYDPYQNSVDETWVSISYDQSKVRYNNIEYWSMRSSLVQKKKSDFGDVVTDVHFADGKLIGTLENQTELTIKNAQIISGKNVEELGDVLPGQIVDVELTYDTSFYPGGRHIPYHNLYSTIDQNNDRQNRMIELLNEQNFAPVSPMPISGRTSRAIPAQSVQSQVLFIGWIEEPLFKYEVLEHKSLAHNLTLLKADIEVQASAEGYVFYPPGVLQPEVIEHSGQLDFYPEGYITGNGEIVFQFDLYQESDPLLVHKIQLHTWSEDSTPFAKEIYNWEKDEYEEYEQVFTNSVLDGEKLSQYLSDEGYLWLKMNHNQQGERHLGQPAIMVEGKVSQ